MSEVFTVSPQPDQLPPRLLSIILARLGRPAASRAALVRRGDGPRGWIGGAFVVRDAQKTQCQTRQHEPKKAFGRRFPPPWSAEEADPIIVRDCPGYDDAKE